MTTYTDEEKAKALLEYGWKQVTGYLFPFSHCEDYDSTFVSAEEADPVIKKGAQVYWDRNVDYDEYIHDLDDAWDYFLDDWFEDNDLEYPNKRIE